MSFRKRRADQIERLRKMYKCSEEIKARRFAVFRKRVIRETLRESVEEIEAERRANVTKV